MINELFILLSILTSLTSLFYLVLYVLFIELRKKLVYQILFRFQLSICLSSISTNFGINLENGSPLCWIQGIVSNIFTLNAVFWLVYLTYVLHNYILNTSIQNIRPKTEIVCWILPIIVTILPLTTSTYGNMDGEWCWVIDTESTPYWASHLWFWVSYYFWIWISIIIMLLYILKIQKFKRTRIFSQQVIAYRIEAMLRNLVHYTLIVIICWIPSTVYDYYVAYYPSLVPESDLRKLVPILSVSMGFISNVHLFTTNSSIKTLIIKFYKARFNLSIYMNLRRESAFQKNKSTA